MVVVSNGKIVEQNFGILDGDAGRAGWNPVVANLAEEKLIHPKGDGVGLNLGLDVIPIGVFD